MGRSVGLATELVTLSLAMGGAGTVTGVIDTGFQLLQNGLEGKGLSVDGALESGAFGAIGGAGGAIVERKIAQNLAKRKSQNFLNQIDQASESFEKSGFPNPYKGHEPQISLGLNEQSRLANFVSDLAASKNTKSPAYHDWKGWVEGGAELTGNQIRYRMYEAKKINFNLESFDLSSQLSAIVKRNESILKIPGNKGKSLSGLFNSDFDSKVVTRWELNTILSDINLLDKTQFYNTASKTITRDEIWARLYAPTLGKIFRKFSN